MCDHPSHALFGNPRCEHCADHHPITFDCRAHLERQWANLREMPVRRIEERPLITIIRSKAT